MLYRRLENANSQRLSNSLSALLTTPLGILKFQVLKNSPKRAFFVFSFRTACTITPKGILLHRFSWY